MYVWRHLLLLKRSIGSLNKAIFSNYDWPMYGIEFQSDDVTKMICLELQVLFDCSEKPIWKKLKKWLFSAANSWEFKLLHITLSLVLVPEVRNRHSIREVSMGLCITSNSSIFTFINASDLKFCTVLTAAVYIAWWGLKVRIEKFAKWWRHTLELCCYGVCEHETSLLRRASYRPQFPPGNTQLWSPTVQVPSQTEWWIEGPTQEKKIHVERNDWTGWVLSDKAT